jgi:prevent-host-death family protein
VKVRVVTATEAKNRFGDMIKGAYLREEHLIVKRDGVPVVAIVPIGDYERLVSGEELPAELRDEMAASSRGSVAGVRLSRLLDFLEEVHGHMPDVSEEEAERDIAEAIRVVRAERAKRAGRKSA